MLRAFAVLSVVLYHADLGIVPGGYLGVDVFFVISGYLMTRMILADVGRGEFSLPVFYMRRAARLLPAALATLSLTTLVAPFLLTPTAWADFRDELIGSLTFTANIVLWVKTDYFAAAADTKPLLHMWSLSLEEQFYLIWPLALLLAPRRVVMPLIVAGIVLSAALAFSLTAGLWPLPVSHERMESAAFFLLPFRIWELLVGAGCAVIVMRRSALPIAAAVSIGAAGLLLLTSALPPQGTHPGLGAVLVSIVTAVILLGPDRMSKRALPVRAAARIGDWSYSIYLVHGPLFAYANSAYLGEIPLVVRLLLASVCIPLGVLQYTVVEARFRHRDRRRPWRFLAGLLAISVALVVVVIWFAGANAGGRLGPSTANVGLHPSCDQRGAVARMLPECVTGPAPRIALLGDSYAMQWGHALASADPAHGGIVQLTKTSCAPVLGLAQAERGGSLAWARECQAFMTSAAEAIAKTASIEVVVLSSSWSQLLATDGEVLEGDARQPATTARIAAGLARMQLAIEGVGKRAIIIGPAPSTGLDYRVCNARRAAGLLTLRGGDCSFSLRDARHRGLVVDGLLTAAVETGLPVVRVDGALCPNGRCATAYDGVPIYADRGHLTAEGAALVARRIRLMERLTAH